ncbi:MAG: PadR family transcriptional regulator, partial [Candidatus Omnitrophica bacterium]|nr:PadR family transcriptional regulator [Candidatus Omnitrophota bacterium]
KEISQILSVLAGIKLTSIYYPLKKLEENGLVIKNIEKKGKRPPRFVYSLTNSGERRLLELLNKSLLVLQRPQFNLDLALYFLHYLKPQNAKRRLRARILILRRLIKAIKKMLVSLKEKNNLRLISILEHNERMVEAELSFLKRFLEEFYGD